MNKADDFLRKFQNSIFETIRKHQLTAPGESIAAGVSGGPDSVCLLHVLYSLRQTLGINLYAVHVNHMLRAEEADLDEEYTVSICRELGVPLHVVRIDAAAEAKIKGISIEEAGREIRYREFRKFAKETGATKIAVAHNRNDQAETVMLNIIRGTGVTGLAGMEYMRDGIIRPLLCAGRDEIEQYCALAGLSPRIDSSNLHEDYTRNKVRLALIPYINEKFGADITDSLCRLAENAAMDESFMERYSGEAYIKALRDKGDGFVRLDNDKLRSLDPAVRMRVLRMAVRDAAGSVKGLGSVHYQALSDLIVRGETGARSELPKGIRAVVSYGILAIYSKSSAEEQFRSTAAFSRKIEVPGVTHVPEIGASVTTEVVKPANIDNYGRLGYNPKVQFFDYDKLIEGIYIRNRRNGDLFKPLGSSGTKKLKEYFIDSKIPREARDEIPLISKGNETIWVIGHKISDKFKVTENTKNVLKIEFNRRGQHDGGY
jgi:tRNA(Ile)-lysidine synthase